LQSQFSGEKIDGSKASVSPLLSELENAFQSVLGVYSEENALNKIFS